MINQRVWPILRTAGRVLVLAVAAQGCARQEGSGMVPPAPEVGVAAVDRGRLPLELAYTARAAGSREVEVRALVSGILLERRYQEGRPVQAGDVLFLIDPDRYRAAAAEAQAEVGVARARLAEARRQHDRLLKLVDKNLVSQQQLDEAISAYEVGEANLAAAEARLRSARLDLGYTEVRAPISGLTSHEARSEGSLVTAGDDSSLVTRIVQTDPIYIEFSMPEGEAALVRGRLATDASTVVVRIETDDGSVVPTPARLTFVDNAVDPGSGTVRTRAVMPNPDGALVPGQFTRVRVEGVALADAVSLPRRAVMSSAQGTFVWVVGGDDTAELRPVRVRTTIGETAVVADGLSGGERVIVDGVLKAQPGGKVRVAPPQGASEPVAGASPE
jgi:membrane fusion protein (multidrug efflux system)